MFVQAQMLENCFNKKKRVISIWEKNNDFDGLQKYFKNSFRNQFLSDSLKRDGIPITRMRHKQIKFSNREMEETKQLHHRNCAAETNHNNKRKKHLQRESHIYSQLKLLT